VDGALFREFHEVPYFFSAGDVERIEFLRSSAAMLNSTTGLSGIINVVPREYPERETSWLAEYGDLNTYRFHVSHGGPAGDNLTYGLGFDGFNTDGPAGRYGAEKSANLFANVTWTPNQIFMVRTSLFHIQGERELVQAVPPAAERFQTALQRFDPIKATVATVKTLIQPNDWATTQFILGYSNRRNTFIAETETSHDSSRDWDSEWSLNLIQSLALMRNNVFRIGANYNHWVAPYGKRFYSGRRSDLESYSATLANEHRFGALLLDGAFRYQKTYINEYGAFNINGSPKGFKKVDPILNQWEPPILSGSLGVSYNLTEGLSLHGNFLAGSLEPRRGTLNTELEPLKTERRRTTDLGIRFARNQLGELSLIGFYTKQKDAIVLSGETETLDGRIMELYENRDQDSKGLEFDFWSRPVADMFSLFFNLVAMRSDADLDGAMTRNPEIPELIIGAGFQGWKWGWDFNLFWKHISDYQSKRFVEPPEYQPLGDYHSINLTAGHNFGSSEQLRLYVEVRNLTDAEFSTVVGYPDYGRRFLVGVRHRF
jgi:outer membrane receptor protein involved in Fe transport